MKKIDLDVKFDVLVLEDVYTEHQIVSIWKELDTFVEKDIFLSPDESGSAKYYDGKNKKKNRSVFIDEVYTKNYRGLSSVLTYPEQNLLSTDVKDMMAEINPCHGIFGLANQHSTLVSYYEKSDSYDFHHDLSAYSTLSYFFREPKSFTGGEILFKVNGEILELPVKNNMAIIFPSSYNHKVNEVDMNEDDLNKGLGRFCISQFVGISLF